MHGLYCTDLPVGMQDAVSNPGVPFACGLTLEKLSAHTVDEEGNEAFVKDNPLSLLRKVRMLSKMACSWPLQTQIDAMCSSKSHLHNGDEHSNPHTSVKGFLDHAGFAAETLCCLL